MSPHRRAYEDRDWRQLVTELEALCVKVDNCWLWSRHSSDGYGKLRVGNENWSAHRFMALAVREGDLHAGMAVHHTCAEGLCIAPAHLQVVTPHENNAEMVERVYYQRRIAELERALAVVSPNHPMLRRISSVA